MSDNEENKNEHQSNLENEEEANRSQQNENNDNENENENEDEGNENEGNENEGNEEEGNKEEENNDDNNIQESRLVQSKEPFFYFEEGNGCDEFTLNNGTFEKENGSFKYCICILMKDDTQNSSQDLNHTFSGINENLKILQNELNIMPQEIGLFIFVNQIYNDSLFNDEDKSKLEEDNKKFIYKERTIKDDLDLKNIRMYTLTSYQYLSEIKALKCYYSILDELSKSKKLIFSSVIKAGVFPTEKSLISLIQFSFENKKSGIAVAPVEYTPSNIYSKISLYEKIHFNLFNMNYYYVSCTVPISSHFCTFALKKELKNSLKKFYNEIYENASIDYHDYNLGLKLKKEGKKNYFIKYNYDKALGMIKKDNMTFFDYQKEWIDRYSGYYGNFFEILRTFIDCSSFDFGEKIFLLFQIIAIATEFILPSLACMVIYTIFYECFNTYDYRVAMFFTLLYLSMMFCSGVCSLITKDPSRMPITNYFLYIFMEAFYALTIVCSVPAMHFVNINKRPEIPEYKFNKLAASLIIILTFIPYIIPMLIKSSTIGRNIVPMILYLFLGATNSTTKFNMAKIWNASDTSGGKKLDQKKSLFIIIYLCFNIFIGSLSFYNNGKGKRVKCVMAFGIMFLVYNFFRTIAILIKLMCKKEESFNNPKLNEKIKDTLNKNVGEEDMESEEKKIKDHEEGENDNNNEDNNEDNNDDNNDDNNNDEENQNKSNEEEKNQNDNNEEQEQGENENGESREVEVDQGND